MPPGLAIPTSTPSNPTIATTAAATNVLSQSAPIIHPPAPLPANTTTPTTPLLSVSVLPTPPAHNKPPPPPLVTSSMAAAAIASAHAMGHTVGTSSIMGGRMADVCGDKGGYTRTPAFFGRLSCVPGVLVLTSVEVKAVVNRVFGSETSLADLLTSVYLEEVFSRQDPKFESQPLYFYSEQGVIGYRGDQQPLLSQAMAAFSQQERMAQSYGLSALATPDDVAQFKRNFPNATPWYAFYRWIHTKVQGCSPYDFVSHPVACVLVCSAHAHTTANVVSAFNTLWPPEHGPALFRDRSFLDPKIEKYYLLLQHQDAPPKFAEPLLEEMRGKLSQTNCSLLKLLSLATPPIVTPEPRFPFSLFTPLFPGMPVPPPDKLAIDDFVKQHLHPKILAWIHRIINNYSQQVTYARKTLTNQMSRWFGRKQPCPHPDLASLPLDYLTRRLADFYMLDQDFDKAVKSYEIFLKDNDGNVNLKKCLAAATEHIALAHFLIGNNMYDSDYYYKAARELYKQSGDSKNALRVSMMHGSILWYRKDFRNTDDLYSALSEQPESDELASAILAEQSAFCAMWGQHVTSPKKICLRILSAGAKYGTARQPVHAMRCYKLVYSSFINRRWYSLENHLNFAMVRFSYDLKKIDEAVEFSTRLLRGAPNLPLHIQNTVLRQFVFLLKARAEFHAHDIPELPLPVIKKKSLSIYLNDDPLLCASNKCPMPTNFMTLKSMGDHVAIIGETMKVELEVINPMLMPLQFDSVQLVALHSHSGFEEQPCFDVSPIDLVLAPCESKKIELSLTPRTIGNLTLLGVSFQLCRAILGQVHFLPEHFSILPSPATPQSKPELPKIAIFNEMPHLTLEADVSPNVLEGEVCGVALLLRNESANMPIYHVDGVITRPEFFCSMTDSPTPISVQPPSPSTPPLGNADPQLSDTISTTDPKKENSIPCPCPEYLMPIDPIEQIPPGGEAKINYFMRPPKTGLQQRYTFHIALRYESSPTSPPVPSPPPPPPPPASPPSVSQRQSMPPLYSGLLSPSELSPSLLSSTPITQSPNGPALTVGGMPLNTSLLSSTPVVLTRHHSQPQIQSPQIHTSQLAPPTEPPLTCRYVHKHYEINVFPSVHIVQYLHPSTCSSQTRILQLKVTNLHTQFNLWPFQVSCISSNWSLSMLCEQSCKQCLIPPKSTANILLKVTPNTTHNPTSSVILSQAPKRDVIDVTQPPYSKFAAVQGKEKIKTKGSPSVLQDSQLIVLWEFTHSGRVMRGQYNTPLCPIDLTVAGVCATVEPAAIPTNHNFVTERCCTTPVSFTLRNNSTVKKTVSIDTCLDAQSTPTLFWSGLCSTKMDVEPNCIGTMTTNACFLHRGMYDLNLVKVSVADSDKRTTTTVNVPHHLVTLS
ncbi:trafficking protein particle complex subunit 8 [Pelomyxa schiedti]|nr:trafficking protein particle complex subunit 8 [Pelomyxa schiedti]